MSGAAAIAIAGVLGAAAIAIAGMLAMPRCGFAQDASDAPPAVHEEAIPAAGAPATISPTVVEAPSARPKRMPAKRHATHHVRHKPPSWVLQSKVQLAMQADARFKNVRVTVTQPGVIVLEGQVFDQTTQAAAGQTAAAVEGVKRVINALTTQTLHWLDEQVRVNAALAQAGYTLVSVKVVGQTAYLSGQVSTDLDKQKVATIVLSTAPDLEVGTNLITTTR
ncbi:MAG: BON domain-containing protein [Candidatus Binataceae bacterium]|nr:BON domain-containing protein [Candidatus Binataceae bacterium]